VSEAVIIFFAAQTVSVIGSVFIAYMKTQVTIAELKSQSLSIQVMVDSLRLDYKSLNEKVDGISRHVALIEGMEMEKAKREHTA